LSGRAVLAAVAAHALATPDACAILGAGGPVCYADLHRAVDHAAAHLRDAGPKVIGLAVDNGPAWAVVDLAAMQAGIPIVPLPYFFSAGQILHAVHDAGIDCIHTDQPERFDQLLADAGIRIASRNDCLIHGQAVTELRLAGMAAATLPAGTAKVTYTSGTTGNPKGVCLGMAAIEQVAHSLLQATEATPADRHVSLLPLSTLLENIAGLYVPLLAGASTTLLPFEQIGLKGASGIDVYKMAGVLAAHAASTTILTPELLQGLTAVVAAGHPVPAQLRFVAVGGAPVAERLLQRAQALGVPVYEGYGLSECASVVSLNTREGTRVGSAGLPLPHVHLKFAEDGEILVGGATLLGYTGDTPCPLQEGFWPTGDRGYLDAQGYLHVTGRKKNIFITSFGRNVSPEWVERELTLHPAIAQAALFGEARPWNTAVIVPRGPQPQVADAIEAAIADANSRLPDYAQVRQWIAAQAPFTPRNGQLTPNGRLRRDVIWSQYQSRIDCLYEETQDVVL
jgi:long-subunit acyl-CoA synthetase (AMP-forming)